MAANHRESAGHSWEIYGDPTPDPAGTETMVVHLLKEGQHFTGTTVRRAVVALFRAARCGQNGRSAGLSPAGCEGP